MADFRASGDRTNITLVHSTSTSKCYYTGYVGRDSSVGIGIRYGLDGPGVETGAVQDFPHPSKSALGPI